MLKSLSIIILLFGFITLSSACAGERALVVVMDLAEEAQKMKLLYKMETAVAKARVKRKTRKLYDHVIFHYRNAATKNNFLKTLETLASNSNIEIIDTIIYIHGKNSAYENGPSVCFVGDSPCTNMQDLAMDIKQMTKETTKLRALYSDACWGEQHMPFWLEAGYKVVSGSRGVDANHSLDLRRFLKKWTNGSTFKEAIDYANMPKLTYWVDRLIDNADSFKLVKGESELNINSNLN